MENLTLAQQFPARPARALCLRPRLPKRASMDLRVHIKGSQRRCRQRKRNYKREMENQQAARDLAQENVRLRILLIGTNQYTNREIDLELGHHGFIEPEIELIPAASTFAEPISADDIALPPLDALTPGPTPVDFDFAAGYAMIADDISRSAIAQAASFVPHASSPIPLPASITGTVAEASTQGATEAEAVNGLELTLVTGPDLSFASAADDFMALLMPTHGFAVEMPIETPIEMPTQSPEAIDQAAPEQVENRESVDDGSEMDDDAESNEDKETEDEDKETEDDGWSAACCTVNTKFPLVFEPNFSLQLAGPDFLTWWGWREITEQYGGYGGFWV